MVSYLKLYECASVALSGWMLSACLMLYLLHFPLIERTKCSEYWAVHFLSVPLSSKAMQRSPRGSWIGHRATEEKTDGEKIWTGCFLTLHKVFKRKNRLQYILIYFALYTWPALQHHIWAKSNVKQWLKEKTVKAQPYAGGKPSGSAEVSVLGQRSSSWCL